MNDNLNPLHHITPLLAKLVDGHDLTTAESEKLFSTIFLYDTTGFHFTALMSAIHAKGETADELLGLIDVNRNLAEKLSVNVSPNKITDLSGTGAGTFKTLNVSTAASFVIAASGYTVAKACYYGITSSTGSADLFMEFGIDIAKLSKEIIEKTLEEIKICPFYIPFISPKLENRGKLFRMVYINNQLKVRTPAHLTTNIFSPLPITHRTYGCYSPKYLEVLANLFMKLGFTRTLTFYAEIGMPEISNVGKTTIVEQNGNNIKKYEVYPSDLGIAEATEDQIQTGGKDQNLQDFITILKGKERGPKADLVAVNAGASLYALGDVDTLREGVAKAKQILNSGEGYKVLEQLVSKVGNLKMLKSLNV